jgi:hypothetical protein
MTTLHSRFRFAAMLALLPATAGMLRADLPLSQPYPPIRFEVRSNSEPAQKIYIARVDLTNPDVDIRVSGGGADPDGGGEYQTTLQVPSFIAQRERFDLVVNGDFFAAKATPDGEGSKSGYVTGKWGKVKGPAVTDGYVWGPAAEARPSLIIDATKHARIAEVKEVPQDALQVMAGSHIIVQNGENCAPDTAGFARTKHPRTAAGITADGKTLVLVVVDGRRPGEATGMSLTELAETMRSLDCRNALNLDGGGSTEMALRDPASGQLQIVNKPSDGRERAVANVLGVSIRGIRRVPNPALSPIEKQN